MGRNLNKIIAELPLKRQVWIDSRYQELHQRVKGLRELRQIAEALGHTSPPAATKTRPRRRLAASS